MSRNNALLSGPPFSRASGETSETPMNRLAMVKTTSATPMSTPTQRRRGRTGVEVLGAWVAVSVTTF